ncbi:hypothetical protein KVV02_003206 [Mortierella alpina]|uniref:DNA replication complex GINS protein PSF2 n=1 Tax=Mortierella alpina TaxID=64518 RepID=A0A9P8A2E4_MORAP|nr:hypothetical protein KVV02_003206 [Mortierella alpina]
MALPRHLKNGLTPLEIEFLAENELIEIAASIDTKQNLELLGGTLPPLKPLQMNKVPLWMAISLKKKQKCNIVNHYKNHSRTSKSKKFSALCLTITWKQLNCFWKTLPVSFSDNNTYSPLVNTVVHITSACDDIPSADAVRTLLKDLREARQSKARKGVEALGLTYIQMDNIGLMEINEIRPFFTKAFYELQKLRPAGDANDVYGAPEPYRNFDGTASFSSSMLDSTRQ